MKRLASVAAASALGLGALVLAPSPVVAAPGDGNGQQLKLKMTSTDPWADTLGTALFGSDLSELSAPGNVLHDDFYVMNNTGSAARFTLACTITGDDPFAERLEIKYQVDSDDDQTNDDVDAFATCGEAPTGDAGFDLQGRQSAQVDIALIHGSGACTDPAPYCDEANEDMQQAASFSITATLRGKLPPQAKGGGARPAVLGVQTLLASEPTSGTGHGNRTPIGQPDGGAPGGSSRAPVRTANAAAVLPEPNVGLTESLPLIGGLLVAGALLAGFRRRRHEAD